MAKLNQSDPSNISPGEIALNAAIDAVKADPKQPLTAGVHALYRLVNQDTALRKKFLDAFLPNILDELEQYAVRGTVSAIGRHQMLAMIYDQIPQVKKHREQFTKKLSEAGYPWVGQVIRRIETGIASGLQIGKENILLQSMHDLQSYVAATNGKGVFGKLQSEVIRTLQDYFRKHLMDSPAHDPEKQIEKRVQLDRLIQIFSHNGIIGSGLEEVQKELATSKRCEPLETCYKIYSDLLTLKERQELLQAASKGVQSAERALKDFQAQNTDPSFRRAVELKLKNVPGVAQWQKTFDHLSLILQYAKQGEVGPKLEAVTRQVQHQTLAYQQACDKLRNKVHA